MSKVIVDVHKHNINQLIKEHQDNDAVYETLAECLELLDNSLKIEHYEQVYIELRNDALLANRERSTLQSIIKEAAELLTVSGKNTKAEAYALLKGVK